MESEELRLRVGIEGNGWKGKIEIVNFSIRVIRLERKFLRQFFYSTEFNKFVFGVKFNRNKEHCNRSSFANEFCYSVIE